MALKNPLSIPKGEKLEIAPGANSIRLELVPKDPNVLAVGPEWQVVFEFGTGSELCVPLQTTALKDLREIATVANAAKLG